MKFNEFNLSAELLAEIEKLVCRNQSHPRTDHSLGSRRKDVIGQAQTGTGKLLPLACQPLKNPHYKRATIQALVIAPTRELAVQSQEELFRFGRSKGVKVRSVTVVPALKNKSKPLSRVLISL